jgi:hypothetical protein
MNRFWILGLGALLCACPNQEDVTPLIHVTPGAADRAWLMGRGKQAKTPATSVRRNVYDTRISILEKGKELGGPNAVGRAGDLVMENDEVVFVIDQLGSGSGFEQSGGNLVDAADAVVRKDELGQLFTFFGEFPRQAVYDKISSAVKDGVGIVTASGHELRDSNLIVTTVYTLHPNDRALLIETTLENRGAAPSGKLGLGDAIQWGAADKFAPGKPAGFKGPTKGPFLGGFGRYTSYAITSTDGDIEAVNGSSWSDTFQKRDVVIAPHEKVHYARVFIVGERADSSSVIAELIKTAGGNIGLLSIDMADPSGNQVMLSGGKISLAQHGVEVLSVATKTDGTTAEVPPGEYDASYAGGAGRSATGNPTHVVVKANDGAHVVVGVSESAHLDLACTDVAWGKPMPCKFTFESLAGTLPIDFGPASAAGPAKNQITTATGTITDLPISPGKYRVTASRGPEYTIVSKDVALAPGGKESFAAALREVLHVDGYLGCDFHQHSMLGADAPTSTIDRVISNAAEGVRIAVASEHNVVADLEPLVKEAGLDGELVEISGDEVTSDAAVIPWGHMNVFPLVRNGADPRGGAFDATKPPSSFIDAVAKMSAPHVVQVNHPRAWNIGYFDLAHFDASIGAGTAPWYDGRFDAVEVWNGRNVESRDKVRADYFSLLLHGHIVTPTANTDTHGVVGQEAGYPRTYVRVQNSGKVTGWDEARTNDLVNGILVKRDTVLTNGPFLQAFVNGASIIGGVAKAKAGKVTIQISVSAAPWVTVDRVGIAFASGAIIEKKISLKLTKSGETSARIDIPIHVTQDDAVSVYAAGDKPLSPVLSGDAKEIAPYAMTSAIWIDADGDGKSLGRGP